MISLRPRMLLRHRPRPVAYRSAFSPLRAASSQAKPVSPHIGFYQSFGRPIAKVFLGAILTYQTVYWLWVKLEKDEMRGEKETERRALEAKLREVAASRTSNKQA